jgi:hypothetical protein
MSIPQVATIYAQTARIFCPLRQQELLYLREQEQIGDGMRVYIMEYLSRELQVVCPIFINAGTVSGVLHTVVKRPYRRYPSHVYLFAVLLWLIGLSMRTAAQRIRILFGISRFSHSTISRTIGRLRRYICEISAFAEDNTAVAAVDNELPAVSQSAIRIAVRVPGNGGQPVQFFKAQPTLCDILYRILSPILYQPERGNQLIYAIWKRYGCMLL